MSYKSIFESNNVDLQTILDRVNALPEAGSGGGDNSILKSLIQRTITEFSDPELTAIGGYAFYYCAALVSVHLPAVTTMEGYAFGGCTVLKEVEFPLLKKVTSNSFRGCLALERADFGVATSIETNVFYNCQALTTLILRSPTVAYISSSGTVFNNTPIANGTGYIYVPRALLSDDDATKDYRRATNWANYAAQFRTIEDYPEITGG